MSARRWYPAAGSGLAKACVSASGSVRVFPICGASVCEAATSAATSCASCSRRFPAGGYPGSGAGLPVRRPTRTPGSDAGRAVDPRGECVTGLQLAPRGASPEETPQAGTSSAGITAVFPRPATGSRAEGPPGTGSAGRRFRAYTAKHLDALTARAGLSEAERLAVRAVATVLPFRTNEYVVEHLIDWDAAPDDPIYRLVFPQQDMLPADDIAMIGGLLARGAPETEIHAAAHAVRMRLNPHPANQLLNIPRLGDDTVAGVQHKYPETVLVFPKQGQTCHAYCSYCFRWAQFVDEPDLKMATDDMARVTSYLHRHPEVTGVLITGGDPMIMGAAVLRRYVEPLLDRRLGRLEAIRIGSKSLAYWPQRFVTDPDADDTLRLFEQVVAAGKSLAFMAHFSHPRELESPMLAEAVRRITATGAVIRTQAPLIRSINDDPDIWATMWRAQQRMGMIPYYMFVERDTGPRAIDVRDPRQGLRGRDRRGGRREGVRPAHDPGAQPGTGRQAVLRPLRSRRHLDLRPRAGVRVAVPVRARARAAARPLGEGGAGVRPVRDPGSRHRMLLTPAAGCRSGGSRGVRQPAAAGLPEPGSSGRWAPRPACAAGSSCSLQQRSAAGPPATPSSGACPRRIRTGRPRRRCARSRTQAAPGRPTGPWPSYRSGPPRPVRRSWQRSGTRR